MIYSSTRAGDPSVLLQLTLIGLLAVTLVGAPVKRLLQAVNYRKTIGQVGSSLLLALGGFLLARLHLWIFDPLYLRLGAIRRFEPPPVAIGPGGGLPPARAATKAAEK